MNANSAQQVVQSLTAAVAPRATDDELWAKVRGEPLDQPALTELYRRWEVQLLTVGRWQGAGSDDADVVNGAFVKLVRRRMRVAGAGRAFRFLFVTVKRSAWKAGARRLRLHEREGTDLNPSTPSASRDADPVARGQAGELWAAVRAALDTFSEREREVLLRAAIGEEAAEIAAALGITAEATRMCLSRARRRLRDRLGELAAVAGMMAVIPAADAAAEATVKGILAAASSGWRMAPLLAVGLFLAGTLTAGGWAAWPMVAPPPAPTRAAVESLEAENERLFRRDVLPELQAELTKLLPPHNPPRFVGVVTYDSWVECEFTTTSPMISGSMPTGVRLRYCTARRELKIAVDARGDAQWRVIDPKRPVIIEFPGLLARLNVDAGHEWFAAGRKVFGKLPTTDWGTPADDPDVWVFHGPLQNPTAK